MTNLAIADSKGLTAYTFAGGCTEIDRLEAKKVLSLLGASLEVRNEDHLDVVTGVSGSGIAYIIHIMDIFEKAAIAKGLSESDAKTIVRETLVGALSLTEVSGKKNKDIIAKIASKAAQQNRAEMPRTKPP